MRFLKNKLFILLAVTVAILIIMGLSVRKNSKVNSVSNVLTVVLSPFQEFINYIGDRVEGAADYLQNVEALNQENEALKLRISELEKEVKELSDYREKNKELKEALNIKDQFSDVEFLGANIIAKDIGNWFNIFTIDRGITDGITVDSAVITKDGLVGRVISSDLVSSKVITIIDEDSTVSARLSKTRDLVFVKGDLQLKNEGLCRLDNIFPDVDISVGDTIETSGLGGIYPKGIIIGKVKEVRRKSSDLNRYAIIEPAVDFKRLEEVFVLESKDNFDKVGEDNR
ncbi:rod shape-determining protein MreC [Acetivibrio mesophilus]|uniref:Cell shape-determining protein MreC n=1 Tax=Acetivibrio mesophilus TaxID=2487273 RepID=A0A4Q0I433_9FIRM|nr:rod shape-determining protein MreC [Acetivibrio mesophilus]ODM26076.1 rod shape-determining protein MreC [Clostridium sp. Bc-iso-3]RXE59044.1 rod shape-determining protein MreC [Acetivibrio mesophilus]HHV28282.1 rod shape-determining protein MreC [Clostridium sp.]